MKEKDGERNSEGKKAGESESQCQATIFGQTKYDKQHTIKLLN